jgi:hypothetical protein
MFKNPKIKRYLISSAVTFITAFCVAILPSIDTFTLADFKNGVIVGAIFVAFRAGIKAVLESLVAK